MNDDTLNEHGASPTGDEFWGTTPDWTGTTSRPRRTLSGQQPDLAGRVKGWLSTALAGGTNATREHRIVDAAAPRPTDQAPRSRRADVDATIFDDLDTEILLPSSRHHVDFDEHLDSVIDREMPAIDPEMDPEMMAFAPTSMRSRGDRSRRVGGGVDPLLARFGAVAVVVTLAIPLAVGWASGRDSTDSISTETAPAGDQAIADQPVVPLGSPSTTEALVAQPAPEPASTPTEAPQPTQATDDDGASGATLDVAADVAREASSGPSTTDGAPEAPTVAADTTNDGAPAVADVNDTADADETASRVTSCAVDYTVVAGDYWIRLAAGAGVPLAELLEANGATVDTPLHPGDEICLPAGSSTPPPPTTTPTTTAPTTTAPTTTGPTTTAPTTTAPTTPPATGEAAMKQIIRDVWPDELEDRAIEIARRESNFVPTAKNFCCYGLFQLYFSVHKGWLDDLGVTSAEQLYDPVINARAAYTLYQRSGGWGPWGF